MSGPGQFISVDGRPLSAERGIGRRIAELYRSYIRATATRGGNATIISNPFMCLHISCPSGSYDVNVDPTKDDILFEDESSVLSLVGDLLADIYGSLGDSTEKQTASWQEQQRQHCDFDMVLTRRRPDDPHVEAESARHASRIPELASPSLQVRSPVSKKNQAEWIQQPHSADEGHNENGNNTSRKDSSFLNPWTTSRMNIALLTPEKSKWQTDGNRMVSTGRHGYRRSSVASRQPIQDKSPILPSPASTNDAAVSPTTADHSTLSTRRRQLPSTSSSMQPSQETSDAEGRPEKDRGSGTLDSWIRGIPRNTAAAGFQISVDGSPKQRASSLSQRAQERLPSHRSWLSDSRATASAIQDRAESSRRSVELPDSVNPVTDETQHPGESYGLFEFQKASAVLNQTADTSPSSCEAQEALDFGHRKKDAIQKRREYIRGLARRPVATNDQGMPSPSPHHNRYLAARAALASAGPNNASVTEDANGGSTLGKALATSSALSVYDPRAYLIRMCDRNNMDGQKEGVPQMKRMQTSKLPFESVPRDFNLHNVRLTITADQELISTAVRETQKSDVYVQRTDGVLPTWELGVHTKSWERRLSMLMRDIYGSKGQNGEGEPMGTNIDISGALARHLSTATEEQLE